jgi:hypothetical protein
MSKPTSPEEKDEQVIYGGPHFPPKISKVYVACPPELSRPGVETLSDFVNARLHEIPTDRGRLVDRINPIGIRLKPDSQIPPDEVVTSIQSGLAEVHIRANRPVLAAGFQEEWPNHTFIQHATAGTITVGLTTYHHQETGEALTNQVQGGIFRDMMTRTGTFLEKLITELDLEGQVLTGHQDELWRITDDPDYPDE